MQPPGASSTTVSVLNATQQDLYGPKNCCDIFTEPVLATIRFRLAVLVFYIAPSLNAIKERLEQLGQLQIFNGSRNNLALWRRLLNSQKVLQTWPNPKAELDDEDDNHE